MSGGAGALDRGGRTRLPLAQRADLRPDCSRCFALCCVALPFARSADFAIDKAGGQPCPNLAEDLSCTIHDRLRETGFVGCAVFDCAGAGQKVSQHTFGGVGWREAPGTAAGMFAVLPVVTHLHELLRYLLEALTLPEAATLRPDLEGAVERVERLTLSSAERLLALDVGAEHAAVAALLRRASDLARAGVLDGARGRRRPGRHGDRRPEQRPDRRRDRSGADLVGVSLVGADLHGASLRGASLRGAVLVGADLRRADLRRADVIGADLRGADLSGTDLTGALFLTASQVVSARGDADTRLPAALERPAHW